MLLWSAGCFDTELPPKLVVGPGTVRATVMTAVPGRSELVPAANARLELLGTTLRAQADADGNVRLSDVSVRAGRLLFSVDLDGDGVAERTRVVTLESVKAGFGLDVNLGQVVVGRNAVVTGVVKRGDRAALPSGHAGITVFLPQLPQVAFSGDDGSFTLGGIPEGDAIVSFFAPGYRPDATSVQVTGGQEVRLGAVVLEANPGGPPVGRLAGRVQQVDGTPIAAVEVRAALGGVELKASTDAEGRFAFETISTGVYALALEKSGFRALRVDGVLVMQGVNEVGP
ncbi:MAG: carboxypeptidase regulatory-like domain-containing protein, partial [Archangium sp.]|nr:carboxypeptidase regulatory-like domain-containing protein [Archangium sp.]